MDSKLKKINTIGRLSLAFIFFYHGLVPKLLWLSATEAALMDAHTFLPSELTLVAGVGEIILALVLVFHRSLIPVYLAAVGLIALLIDVAVIMPELLIEAFNPVTTNISAIVICIIIILSAQENVRIQPVEPLG